MSTSLGNGILPVAGSKTVKVCVEIVKVQKRTTSAGSRPGATSGKIMPSAACSIWRCGSAWRAVASGSPRIAEWQLVSAGSLSADAGQAQSGLPASPQRTTSGVGERRKKNDGDAITREPSAPRRPAGSPPPNSSTA